MKYGISLLAGGIIMPVVGGSVASHDFPFLKKAPKGIRDT